MSARIAIIAILFAVSLCAKAADVTLRDGRTFKSFQIVDEDASTVTIRYKVGVAKVDKKQLPADLLAAHPIDQAAVAAAAAEKKAAEEEKAAEAQVAAEKEKQRVAEIRQQEHERDEEFQKEQLKRLVPSYSMSEVKEAVRQRADRYFKAERTEPNGSLTLELKMTLDAPREVQGWPGRFEVVGVAWWQSLESSGPSYSSGKSWFRAEVWPSKDGTPEVREFSPLISEPIR